MDELYEKASQLVRDYKIAACLGVVGFVLLLYSLIAYGSGQKAEEAVTFSAADDAPQTGDEESSPEFVVDVAGAVVRPGVYKVKEGSRFQDAILAAGGMSEEADQAVVAKQINLAAKVSDGMKIYVPFRGESSTSTISTTDTTSTQGSLININSVGVKELDTLPGVGPVTSEKIINGRPYQAVDDLLKRKIVSQKVYDQIKEMVSVY